MLYQPVITFPTALEKGYALILIFASVNKVGMELTARSTHVNTLIIVQVSLICDSIRFDFSNSIVSYFSPPVLVFFNLFTLFFTRDLKVSDGDVNENVISKYNFRLS